VRQHDVFAALLLYGFPGSPVKHSHSSAFFLHLVTCEARQWSHEGFFSHCPLPATREIPRRKRRPKSLPLCGMGPPNVMMAIGIGPRHRCAVFPTGARSRHLYGFGRSFFLSLSPPELEIPGVVLSATALMDMHHFLPNTSLSDERGC